MRSLLFLAVVASLAFSAGCATGPRAGTATAISVPISPIVESSTVSVPVIESPAPPAMDYVVGPSDVLFVSVYGRPDMGSFLGSTASKLQGSRIDGKGDVSLPLVGAVHVGGLTLSQVRECLQREYGRYLTAPSVVVEVADYRSQPLYLMGQFKAPGVYYMDRPLTLVQAVSLGSGFDPSADLRGIRLLRGGRIVPVDLYELLREGSSQDRLWVQPSDTIYVPDNRNQNVFVFGAVKKAGPIPMPQGRLTLTEAIAAADLRDAGYDIGHVRIIRSLSTTRGELLVVDFRKVLDGEALPVLLQAGDIVYVPKTGVGTWNEAINDILPSLQLVGAVLNPFVQIKYLAR